MGSQTSITKTEELAEAPLLGDSTSTHERQSEDGTSLPPSLRTFPESHGFLNYPRAHLTKEAAGGGGSRPRVELALVAVGGWALARLSPLAWAGPPLFPPPAALPFCTSN